jgi:muramidase (phage lysozyme)
VTPAPATPQNVAAFLAMIRHAEGTSNAVDPYAVCYGYGHTIADFSDHPAVTGEWRGKRLSDAMCRNAGLATGCVSTAAGAYQIIKPTWISVQKALKLPDFTPASQDLAALELVRRRGALSDVRAGRIGDAIMKCKDEWASLPGNYAGQGQRSRNTLIAWYVAEGGIYA